MNGLTFYGGLYGVVFGNQQFTVRNLTFYNAYTAINQLWDWGWTYSGISVINCSIGLNMSTGNSAAQSVDSVTLIDSTFTDTPVAILTARNSTSLPVAAGSLILENIGLVNVPVAVQGPQGTVLAGGTTTITAWGQGHEYTPNGPTSFEGPIKPNSRPQSLTIREKFYARSKPQYEAVPLLQFVSARTAGAKGDGVTDDTFALNILLWTAAAKGQIVFLDAGTYKVTSTIYIPPRSKIVGESYPVIMGSGSYFSDINNPQPIICAGSPGEFGVIEWSDTIVSTQGATAGAILIEWNLASPEGVPSGLWDVHTRIGGFAGSNLQLSQCPPTPWTTDYVDPSCIAAFMSLHIAPTASGLYLENNWFWTADHDIEDPLLTQITVFSGRGLYDSSVNGVVWLVGTAVEHHSLYQYQFANTKNIFAGQIQTETPYFQPNPDATAPFQPLERWNDPDFHKSCEGVAGNCADAWGLRIVDSQDILIYGGGLYSFFENYSTSKSPLPLPFSLKFKFKAKKNILDCSNQGNGETCQTRIFSIEGSCKDIDVYNLNTVGTTHMITRDGVDVASYDDNLSGFADTIALFRIDSA
jgi:glucan 1,3-beta-glucosidase